MSRPRIEPGGLREVGPINWIVCRALSLASGTPDGNLFWTLARHRGLFRGWLMFAGRMMPGGTLPRLETELVILRVAHLRRCQYEIDHHVRQGRRFGVTAELAARVEAGPLADGWEERHRALLLAVDSLVRQKDIDDAGWDALRAHYGERELVELCLLVGHYDMLATFIGTLRIARDAWPSR